MTLTKALPGGDTDWDEIKKALIGLAKKETKVVFRTSELHDEVELANGKVQPVTACMVVCSGPHKGKVLRDFRHQGRGVTGPLRRAWANGDKEVASRLEAKRTGTTDWVAAQTPNDDDFELIEAFYGDGTKAWKGPDLVESEGAPATNGLAKADDDGPPPF
ncbi:MAG TPA: hypothetical protein VK735_18175 [Pseudonocardia sp.]|uniref:hypothetical protein n=1 Tax=Pseudonocardia sp. TaxID=60912 RepID=UPI002D11B727|nr:hypothetical protein [Pseudonocardia sp.]HTF49372.1 hypothetical protein [Pseudonocardia sp.]